MMAFDALEGHMRVEVDTENGTFRWYVSPGSEPLSTEGQ